MTTSAGYAMIDPATGKVLSSQSGNPGAIVVQQLADFPAPVGGVITLADNVVYQICGAINLGANRIVCGENTVLSGFDSSLSKLISSQASIDLISTTKELFIEKLTITASGTGSRAIYANGDGTKSIRIRQCAFIGCARVGTIINYYGAIVDSCFLFYCSQGWDCDGTFRSILHDKCGSTSPNSGFTYLTIPSTFTATVRLIIANCGIDVPALTTGLSVNGAASIPVEGYVIVASAFTGAGAFTAGLDENSAKSYWKANIGLFDTYPHAGYYMDNNVSATTIPNTTSYVKLVGATQAADTTGFTLTANKSLYTGSKQRKFLVSGCVSISSAIPNQSVIVAIAVNGNIVNASRSQAQTGLSSQTETFPVSAVVTLNPNDYVELFARNTSTSSNLTWKDGNVFITEI